MILCTSERGGKISGDDLPANESGRSASNNTYERKVLPPELWRNVVMLTCESAADGGVCDVYLVGTTHVSKKSPKEVKAVIEFLKPQVVFLELCSRGSNALHAIEKIKIGEVEVLYGAEFHVAYEEAMTYRCKVILGDRPSEITDRRTWAKMSLWHQIKLLYSLLFEGYSSPSPEDLTKMEMNDDEQPYLNQVLNEIKKFPCFMEIKVHERGQYMSAMLLRVVREHNSVVAVVGRGHLPGIQKNWKQPVDVEQLLSSPSDNDMHFLCSTSWGCDYFSLWCLHLIAVLCTPEKKIIVSYSFLYEFLTLS